MARTVFIFIDHKPDHLILQSIVHLVKNLYEIT